MIDKAYVAELKELDTKEAKDKLDAYASEFGIKLRKNKSFDNMVADLEVEFEKLKEANSEGPEDVDGGISTTDLIDALDAADGKLVFNEIKEEAKLLIDQPVSNEVKIVDLSSGEIHTGDLSTMQVSIEGEYKVTPEVSNAPQAIEIKHQDETHKFNIKLPEGVSAPQVEETPEVIETIKEEIKVEQAAPEVKPDSGSALPPGFSPTLQLVGRNPGYCTLPWWIYAWILETPNWKNEIPRFQHASAHSTLYSLLYYIQRDGAVTIRETRNSSFNVLE